MSRCLESETATSPVPIEQAISIALSLHKAGRRADAFQIYGDILRVEPNYPDALHYLGVLAHEQGSDAEAVLLMRKSVDLAPGHAGFRVNLGNLYLTGEQFSEAEWEYAEALKLDPGNHHVLNNYAVLCKVLGRYAEAERDLLRVIELAPDFIDARSNLASLYMQMGRIEESIEQACEALVREPAGARPRELLGAAYVRLGRLDEAAAVYAAWAEDEPDNPQAQHYLVACTGKGVPERASNAYVQTVFDTFADSFDAKLARLQYRAPTLLAECVRDHLGERATALDVLDAGCGTGLCGPLLRPHARSLTGIDLSAGMLAKARSRGLYDALHHVELVAYMAAQAGAYDLVISADTLVYFGPLEAAFAAAAVTLRPGGHFCFTVEALESDEEAGYRLLPHGRYAHTGDYVGTRLAAAGFSVIEMMPVTLRHEGGEPVRGWRVLAAKPQQWRG